MSKFRILILAGVALALGGAAPAIAKECKAQAVTADGKLTLTRIAAYPHSLIAWRKAVKEEHGAPFQAWRRAKNREINCERVLNDAGKKRWQCTRTAIPCANKVAGYKEPDYPYPGYVLRKGASGKDVETLQQLLDEAGYDVAVDGDFGRKTRKAVRAFQKEEAIHRDGLVGPETWERLTG